ncbi:hypothetical protein SARC_11211 [Sphaeroforma arctica JP610]|uniref:Calcium load-activated calcium channel n=1 Tax=Sphaeroforma arctica JP610 TaxID=667725 RepID=A0A0L0FIH3_9EUKA|nr:hypothetical protein SARC_11211 [Sphaeroforma arctica JP610]KNC76281.1 hypothetical protein SARC_11211 [Sphaeroforma arctica JP610]|eukprot:XP_014150183.1 hypothetical protein SARC_11211 [Sphaeroforma arctica JP610]
MTWGLDLLLAPLQPIVLELDLGQRCLVPLVMAVMLSVFTETIAYFMLYRKEEYWSTLEEINVAQGKYNREDRMHRRKHGDINNVKNKKIPFLETKISDATGRLNRMKMFAMFAQAVVFISVMSSVNNTFGGIVFAKLPFMPFSLAQNITHRGLDGEDYREASFLFIYVMCTTALRPVVPKLLGTTHRRAKPGDSFIAGFTSATT